MLKEQWESSMKSNLATGVAECNACPVGFDDFRGSFGHFPAKEKEGGQDSGERRGFEADRAERGRASDRAHGSFYGFGRGEFFGLLLLERERVEGRLVQVAEEGDSERGCDLTIEPVSSFFSKSPPSDLRH
ncbi:hypothetical protein QQP08_009558 [Theobroma cacao]|nr:hypothetical protein QQP08_009558 [Theobroma cacao]